MTGTTAAVAAVTFFAFRYKVAGASEYLVKTGWRVKDVHISKKTLQLPMQKVKKFSITPKTFPINVHAMSSQRIPFNLPSVWTIGPKDELLSLEKYVKLILDQGEDGIKKTVEGVIQGEVRVLTANLDLNKLFSEREQFKDEVVDKISKVLAPFGLKVYNANIAELSDLDDHNRYFEEQKKRALQEVNQQARIAVAQSTKEGEVGAKIHQAEERTSKIKIETDTIKQENERKQEIAQSNKQLAVAEAQYQKEVQIAYAEANAAAEQKTCQLQMEVEKARKEQEIEKQRAKDLATANVVAEIAIQKARGDAEAIKIIADAHLYHEQKKAEGNYAIAQAQARGLEELKVAAGGSDALNRYLLIEKEVLPKLAKQQAKAVKGMRPRVSNWYTGTENNPDSKVSATLTDLFKIGMPLFEGIKQQTGYDFLGSAGIKKEEHPTNPEKI